MQGQSHSTTTLPIIDMMVSLQRYSLDTMTRLTSESIDLMLHNPRMDLQPFVQSSHAMLDICEQTLAVNRKLIDATTPVFESWFALPFEIMGRVVRPPVEAAVVKFRQAAEDIEEHISAS